uniref:Phage portal protein n=1 Tax=Globodera pallida TaxID=36090 RepID=A0A183CS13_GLOPA
GGRRIDAIINDEGDFSKNDDVTQERELRLATNSPGMESLNEILMFVALARNLILREMKNDGTLTEKDGNFTLTAEQLKEVKANMIKFINQFVEHAEGTNNKE